MNYTHNVYWQHVSALINVFAQQQYMAKYFDDEAEFSGVSADVKYAQCHRYPTVFTSIDRTDTVRWRYNAVNFLKTYSQNTPHIPLARVRYGVSFYIQHLIDILP